MLSEASRLLLKLKSTDEYCYILFSAFNKFAEEPKDIRNPLEYSLDLFSGKWNSRILSVLANADNLRYGEIKSRIDNITDAVLAASLKELISSQMIVRQSYDEIPPKIEYSLSEKGRSIIHIFEMISKCGEKYYVDDDSNSDLNSYLAIN